LNTIIFAIPNPKAEKPSDMSSYTPQRVTADLILSMHLLRRDLDRLVSKKAPQ
jgi:hypothetical protein